MDLGEIVALVAMIGMTLLGLWMKRLDNDRKVLHDRIDDRVQKEVFNEVVRRIDDTMQDVRHRQESQSQKLDTVLDLLRRVR